MANYSNLKAAIAAAIKTNGNQEITGQVLQDVLTSMVSVIGANYTFAGVATPATNPGTPDQNVMYLAMEGGTYTNFNGTVLPAGISLLMWNGTWMSETVMYGDGGVFDISVYKSSGGTLATFADIAAALDGGNNIPASARKGGMSVKFVCSSDNKYVQYRLKANAFSTTVSDWVNVEKTIDERVLKGISDVVSYGPDITTDGSNDMNKLKPNIMVQAVNLQMSNSPVSTMNGFIISGDCTNQSDNHGRFQIYMQTYGAYYIRYNWTYDGSWTNWLYGDSVNSLKSVVSQGYISDVSAYTTDGTNDINKLKKNTVVGLFDSTAINTPYSPNFSGQIITIGSFVEQNYSKIQIATNGDKFWFRYNLVYDGTYGNWINLNNKFAGNSGYLATLNSITTDGTDDADKLPPYIMVGLIGSNSAHLPVSNMNGWLMSISGTENGTYGNIQMAFANGNVYYRYNYSYDGAYSGWENLTRIYSYVNYCPTFLKVALVGDSITEGLMPKMDGTFVSNGNYSWGNLLFTRATIQNTAQSGATAKTYLTDATLSARLQNLDNKTELVVVYLGTNQISDDDTNPISIGTDADIVANWDDTNVNTYYGWYSKLYKTIRHYTNEYCPIVVLGKFDNPYQAMYQDCATKCGCLFINLNTYGNLYYKLPNNNDGNHFTSAGYAGVAKAIEFGLNECIENNPTAFNKTAQILSL